jgi:hypothetical protein
MNDFMAIQAGTLIPTTELTGQEQATAQHTSTLSGEGLAADGGPAQEAAKIVSVRTDRSKEPLPKLTNPKATANPKPKENTGKRTHASIIEISDESDESGVYNAAKRKKPNKGPPTKNIHVDRPAPSPVASGNDGNATAMDDTQHNARPTKGSTIQSSEMMQWYRRAYDPHEFRQPVAPLNLYQLVDMDETGHRFVRETTSSPIRLQTDTRYHVKAYKDAINDLNKYTFAGSITDSKFSRYCCLALAFHSQEFQASIRVKVFSILRAFSPIVAWHHMGPHSKPTDVVWNAQYAQSHGGVLFPKCCFYAGQKRPTLRINCFYCQEPHTCLPIRSPEIGSFSVRAISIFTEIVITRAA